METWWSRKRGTQSQLLQKHVPVVIAWYQDQCTLCNMEMKEAWPPVQDAATKAGIPFVTLPVLNPEVSQAAGIQTVPVYHLVTAQPGASSPYGLGTSFEVFGSILRSRALLLRLQTMTR